MLFSASRMPLSQYLVGLGFFGLTVGASAVATGELVRRRLAEVRGPARVLAQALLFTSAVLVAHLIPLALGILDRPTVLVTAVLMALLTRRVRVGHPPGPAADCGSGRPQRLRGPEGRGAVTIAVLAVGSAALYELARLRGLWAVPLSDIDVMNFHLPGVARWIQSGSLWQIDQLFPFFVTGYYPNNGDLLTLALVLPWRMAGFARYVEVPFLALTAFAVYALGCELGARRTTAAACAAALITIPALSDYALEGLPDVVMLFFFATGTLFLVRHGATRCTRDLVLAGLGLGLAFGTKWYGVTAVAAVMVIWLMLSLAAGRGMRTVRDALGLLGMVLAGGGIWLVRNVVESGNPLFPQRFTFAGLQLFPAPHNGILDRVGFTILGYLGNPSVFGDYIIPGLRVRLGLAGLLFALAILAAVVMTVPVLRRRPQLPSLDHALLGLALAASLVSVLYAATPGSAFGVRNMPVESFTTVRWLMPAPVLAAAVAAGIAGRLGRLHMLVAVVALFAVRDGIRRGPSVTLEALAVTLLVLGAAGGLLWWARRSKRLRSVIAAPAGWGVMVALAMALVLVVGRVTEERVLAHRYGGLEPTIAWIEDHAPAGKRIGLAGVWSVHGLSPGFAPFGPRLGNQVIYVGPWEEDLLREYVRPGPFQSAVRTGHYDLVLIGRGQPPRPRVSEEDWVQAIGFRLVAASDRLALYQAPAPARPGP